MRLFLGQRAWVLQRLTALVLLFLLALGAATLLIAPPFAYERWYALATSTHGAVLIVVFFATLALHGWIGVRDIALDYVHAPFLRLAVLTVVGVILFAIVIRVVLTMAAHFAGGA
ncbi:succinate dehydrogenase, hydrophobic membrane anchor protein [Aromatoleum toluclasticum]|uniref:succinate dehydrogenase, hydrophobic membrane anchor protein n=1 Tax=Aromatoleum toluclasticum TaxID=92003 RepID=UPI001D18F26A|nr:succinate dehydrogenase, hydrophobic membrane anchor protein [Aromatoleum toluclasticum]MCC4115998.1 succinate dehydrogenase, hydrophobic membrane anchor protein [Aromatoleum toluclasticum]